nr:unnamed protein product [Callosobruchus analis]
MILFRLRMIIEFFNSINPPGTLQHRLRLKVGTDVMLLRNLNTKKGVCNGNILVISSMRSNVIEAKVSSSETISISFAISYLKLCHPVIVGKLIILFVDKYPELESLVKYEYSLKYFKENFNLKFRRPHVDCKDSIAAAELRVHKRRAKKFYNKIKEAQTLCTEVMGLAIDYMQNVLLPYTPVQEFFIIGSSGCTHSKYVHNIKENPGDGSKRETFAVSNYKQFLYESSIPGYVKTWEYIDGLHSDIIKLLKEHKENPPLPNNGAYKDPVPINEKKIADIKKLLEFMMNNKAAAFDTEQLQFNLNMSNDGFPEMCVISMQLEVHFSFTAEFTIDSRLFSNCATYPIWERHLDPILGDMMSGRAGVKLLSDDFEYFHHDFRLQLYCLIVDVAAASVIFFQSGWGVLLNIEVRPISKAQRPAPTCFCNVNQILMPLGLYMYLALPRTFKMSVLRKAHCCGLTINQEIVTKDRFLTKAELEEEIKRIMEGESDEESVGGSDSESRSRELMESG